MAAATTQQQHARTDDPPRRPAQVPGDAESPPQGTPSEARKAPNHTDLTEPTHSEQDPKPH